MSFNYIKNSIFEMDLKKYTIQKHKKQLYFCNIWLFSCLLLCVFLIILGAYTRLSNAGLSISYWKPLTGWIPPLTLESWIHEFEIYKNFPEYKYINYQLTLSEFQYIFIIEYLHRLVAKILGFIYILPGLYFLIKKNIEKKSYIFTVFCILLQGFFGWFMVKSGLIDQPFVNHIKLAIHLKMGIIIYATLLYSYKNLNQNIQNDKFIGINTNTFDVNAINFIVNENNIQNLDTKNGFNKKLLNWIIIIFGMQIFLGGMMAGLDAGKIYQSFPLMGKTFIPYEIWQYGVDFNDAATVHFFHRICGYILAISLIIFNIRIIKIHPLIGFLSIFLIFLQICFGVMILFFQDSIFLPLLHSFMALIIASLIVEYHFLV